jgi:hypothetical protein
MRMSWNQTLSARPQYPGQLVDGGTQSLTRQDRRRHAVAARRFGPSRKVAESSHDFPRILQDVGCNLCHDRPERPAAAKNSDWCADLWLDRHVLHETADRVPHKIRGRGEKMHTKRAIAMKNCGALALPGEDRLDAPRGQRRADSRGGRWSSQRWGALAQPMGGGCEGWVTSR